MNADLNWDHFLIASQQQAELSQTEALPRFCTSPAEGPALNVCG
jgi:hypothetical protein